MVLVFFVVLLAAAALNPVLFLFGVGYLYALAGILLWLLGITRGAAEDDEDIPGNGNAADEVDG